ncbi:Os03g0632200 [Oryza sativa Japonica Group]|uniref:Os03g0632200 protein n=1 Tax=Oryza sativa subsp. japonica TaxID=39947 RepID=A0A0P0W0H6_ORYSJ|nr:hypothetical protein EE612_019070 [Oryza sativa]BAS85375.1 Os03g0632200 [Oryza sativa Japonica Group]
MKDFYRFDSYLVFDPTISTHYEIFKIPRVPSIGFRVLDPMLKSLQRPPSLCVLLCVLQVFSSRTRQWGERLFVRDGAAACTVTDMALAFPYDHHNAVYWHGTLYVHCQGDFIMMYKFIILLSCLYCFLFFLYIFFNGFIYDPYIVFFLMQNILVE